MNRILVSNRPPFVRIALLNGAELAEYYLWNLTHPDGIADLHTARITAKLPALAGAFADLGAGLTGFLPDSAGARHLTEGSYFTAEVTRAPQGGKGARLKHLPSPPNPPPGDKPGLLQRGPGPLLELAARFPTLPVLVDDYALIASLRPALASRLSYQAETFNAALEDEIAALAEPHMRLPNGAALHIEILRAFCGIDIDSGSTSAGLQAKASSQLSLNLNLIPAITRQIILRNLSGAILLDFAGMKPKARLQLAAPLAQSLRADPLGAKFIGISHLGFAEISRPRRRPPLHEYLNHDYSAP